jgi:toxin ParE1/3/4
MKKYDVIIAEQADHDLRSIYEYIAYDLFSPENAERQLYRLEKSIEGLDTFPERHRLIEFGPWESRNLRVLPVDNYCVFYITDTGRMTVTVIRVIYSGRDIDEQLNKFTELHDRLPHNLNGRSIITDK